MENKPEINFAKRLLEKHSLFPPVDVFNLARSYATVELTIIPGDVDGVTLNLKVKDKEPHIIVNQLVESKARQRFTLAHELGHVIIPWHVGTLIIDDIDATYGPNDNYWTIEDEANRFAAELLIPTVWVDSLVKQMDNPADTHKIIAHTAQVSSTAAGIKLIKLLPPGYIFCGLDRANRVQLTGRSPDTIAGTPTQKIINNPEQEYPYCEERWTINIDGNNYYWWRLPAEIAPPTIKEDARDWRTVLNHILDDMKFPSYEERDQFRASLMGVIAYANGLIKRGDYSRERLYNAMLQRIHSQNGRFQSLLVHADFETFLNKRLAELMSKPT